MHRFVKKLFVLLFAFTGMFWGDASADSNHHVKYIQGGAPNGGNGSKRHPYNSLAQAQAGNWQKLIVLPSDTLLYGGITLKDGQEIEGKRRSKCLFASSDDTVNNGDIIVANGDNSISGITITTAFRSAINAGNSANLTVTNSTFNNCNPTNLEVPFDYLAFSTDQDFSPYVAIDFDQPGPTVSSGIQPFNIRSGRFIIDNCSFYNNSGDIVVGSGNSVSTSFVNQKYVREYDISNCEFANTVATSAIVPYANGGACLFGSIRNCTFTNQQAGGGIEFDTIRANNPNFPGRGNIALGKNEWKNNFFSHTFSNGILSVPRGNLTAGCAKLIVKNSEFVDCGLAGQTPPAGIEFASAAIQGQLNGTSSGKPWHWIVDHNLITDSTGLLPAITFYFTGGSQKVLADYRDNNVVGTTTGVDILYFNLGGAEEANGNFYIANNSFKDNDSVLIVAVAPDSPFTDLKVKVEKNCFQNTGARNSPPIPQTPPFNNASYYGGAVIYGGAHNAALADFADGSDLGNATVDLGGGPLHSKGHNSFINTTGADFWVEPGLVLWAEKNWFGGSAPVDAGVGGYVLYEPILRKGPSHCRTDSR